MGRKIALFSVLFLLFALTAPCGASALPGIPSYVLVYENLYPYGKDQSEVLDLYQTLRDDGADVYLARADGFDRLKFPENAAVVVVASGFDRAEEYQNFLKNHPGKQTILYEGNKDILPIEEKTPSVMICVSEVYPFSDLNQLMDTAELLHQRGVEFICTLMPMYENTDFKAFDRFIEVLSYVESQGGKFFIRFPVFNPDGTYGTDPKETFSEALSLYRNRGLTISGIEVSLDRLLTNDTLFEGQNLPVVLVTPSQGKLNSDTDYFEISKGINKYVVLCGVPIEDINPYAFSDQTSFLNRQVIRIDLLHANTLPDLLDILKSRQLPVTDFRLSDYAGEYADEDFTVSRARQTEKPKSQLELFKEKELEKIKGENLGADQKIQNYDISKLFHTVILTVLGIVLLLSIQLYVGRKLDVKKIFKK